jgi:Major Facilitator Superfamily
VTAYLVTFSALLITGGRLTDRYGRGRILLAGLAVFTGASAVAGTAPDGGVLLAARAVQGAGAALILPAGLAVVAAGRTARQRDAGAAVWMAALAAALAAGPVAGGWLSEHLGWRWIFLVNLPFGLAGMLVAGLAPGRTGGHPDTRAARAEPVGLAGLISCTAMLGALTYVLLEGPALGWTSLPVAGAAAAGCLAAGCWRWSGRRAGIAMIDSAVARDRVLAGGIAVSVLWGAGVNGVLFFTSLFLQRAAGFSATRAGLVFLPLAVIVVVCSPVAPGLAGRFGAARTVAAGLAGVAAGLAAIALVRGHVSMPRLLPGLAAIGVGSALTVPLTPSVLAAVPASATGVAGGLLGLAREASGLVGISVIGVVVTAGRAVPAHGRLGGSFVSGYGAGLFAAAGLALAGAVIAGLTLPGRGTQERCDA